MTLQSLKVKKLEKDAILPQKAHDYDAGFDIFSNERKFIKPGEHAKIKSGIAIDIPEGHVGLLTARSGINHKSQLRALLGVIDAGYHGDVSVLIDNRFTHEQSHRGFLYNAIKIKDYTFDVQSKYFVDHVYEIDKGDKIAQLVIVPLSQFSKNVECVEYFENQSERGESGFGSTKN